MWVKVHVWNITSSLVGVLNTFSVTTQLLSVGIIAATTALSEVTYQSTGASTVSVCE